MKNKVSSMKSGEAAVFGGGCFWCTEAIFKMLRGVISVAPGYAGGAKPNPTYEDVCSDKTGHAEAVEVTYDPSKVSYDDLLKVFWDNHDPTQVNRQGPDVGTQYRSVIFYHNEKQKKAAMASLQQLQKSAKYKNRKIVTEIVAAQPFYRAEEYHQQYLEKRGLSTCHI